MIDLMGKDRVRSYFKKIRSELGESARAGIDATIANRLFALDVYRASSTLLCYMSFGDEIDTRRIIECAFTDEKVVAIPRCLPDTHTMQWHRIENFTGLERNAIGIDQPRDDPNTRIDPALLDESAVALIPGLAFDEAGNRIGYGGGYFDTFLARFDKTSVGLCREAQLCESLRNYGALSAHDRPVDIVLTESRTITASNAQD